MILGIKNESLMVSCKKRSLILLEVIIAFTLVILCLLPLIYPQVFILKSEKKFIETIELDHQVNLLYGILLQKLYLNEINWDDIEGEHRMPINEAMLQESGISADFPFTGEYQFFIIKRKPPKPEDHLYLIRLILTFTSKQTSKSQDKPKFTYSYDIFIERRPKKVKEEEVKSDAAKEEKS